MKTGTLILEEGLLLESGVRLAPVEIAYRTWGRLDGAAANGILVCHALTGPHTPPPASSRSRSTA